MQQIKNCDSLNIISFQSQNTTFVFANNQKSFLRVYRFDDNVAKLSLFPIKINHNQTKLFNCTVCLPRN